jgi:hypothetical protein
MDGQWISLTLRTEFSSRPRMTNASQLDTSFTTSPVLGSKKGLVVRKG